MQFSVGGYSVRLRAILQLVCGALAITAVGSSQSQTGTVVPPKFEVASVKPCRADLPPDLRSGGGISSPETLDINCQTVKGLISMAFVAFANGERVTPSRISIEGGPSWINSERYDIKAKAEGVKSQVLMHGPMLQALLEDRFQLKVHRATRDTPVYALTLAKGGAKLQPFKEGSCNPYDIAAMFPPPPPPENPCRSRGTMEGGMLTVDAQATTLDDFARFVLGVMDRPVINKTGIQGRFDFHLEYAPDETSSPAVPSALPRASIASEPSGPPIFTAVQQQLGLRLDPKKGPGEYLVIDRVERPSEN